MALPCGSFGALVQAPAQIQVNLFLLCVHLPLLQVQVNLKERNVHHGGDGGGDLWTHLSKLQVQELLAHHGGGGGGGGDDG